VSGARAPGRYTSRAAMASPKPSVTTDFHERRRRVHNTEGDDRMRVLLNTTAALLLLGAATMAQAGCMRCEPVHNVVEAPVTSASGKALTEDQVKSAIIRAGAALGWQMREAGPGLLTATLNLRKHQAEIAIPYSTKKYDITYKSSINLDASDGQIHKNYNGWIQNLNRGIGAQLSGS
jgi:hypothetical protein